MSHGKHTCLVVNKGKGITTYKSKKGRKVMVFIVTVFTSKFRKVDTWFRRLVLSECLVSHRWRSTVGRVLRTLLPRLNTHLSTSRTWSPYVAFYGLCIDFETLVSYQHILIRVSKRREGPSLVAPTGRTEPTLTTPESYIRHHYIRCALVLRTSVGTVRGDGTLSSSCRVYSRRRSRT